MILDKKLVKDLSKLGIHTVSDLLFYFPFRHEDFSNIVQIGEIAENDTVSLKAQIKQIRSVPGFRKFLNRAEAVISDETGSLKVVWFNQSYLTKYLKDGDEVFLAGTARRYKNVLQLQNPVWEKIKVAGAESIHTGRIIPVYRLTGNLTLRNLRAAIFEALKELDKVKETLPRDLIKDLDLPDIRETIQNIHFPESQEIFERAKLRIAFEEIFYVQLAVQKHRLELGTKQAPVIAFNRELVQDFISHLPFELTAEQKKATWEILQDIEKKEPMNRLLEGDVGSGKTAVAFTVAAEVLATGHQVVLLCPTEILAQQHYNTALKYFKNYPHITQILLTAHKTLINNEKAGKSSLLKELSHGGSQLIISTHAALQKNVQFDNIALIIIDEQHRFGVRQRAELREKRQAAQKTRNNHAHTLSMSATPIPRTLKLAVLGDLAITEIKHKPPGRKPVITRLVTTEQRDQAYDFVRKEIKAGRQVFVVTPLIEQSDRLGVKAATTEQQNLQKIFKEFKVGLLHGKMKSEDKEAGMADFLSKKNQILVSTSVIEVGVDVPNAAIIIIEGAERFGLAQLHQFRGRVGRSEQQAYCLLFTENKNENTIKRLENFTKTNDGFELAELDLKNRGFGNIFGEEQSGFYYFKYFSFFEHQKLTEKAQQWAKKIIAEDPNLNNYPHLRKQVEDKIIHNE